MEFFGEELRFKFYAIHLQRRISEEHFWLPNALLKNYQASKALSGHPIHTHVARFQWKEFKPDMDRCVRVCGSSLRRSSTVLSSLAKASHAPFQGDLTSIRR